LLRATARRREAKLLPAMMRRRCFISSPLSASAALPMERCFYSRGAAQAGGPHLDRNTSVLASFGEDGGDSGRSAVLLLPWSRGGGDWGETKSRGLGIGRDADPLFASTANRIVTRGPTGGGKTRPAPKHHAPFALSWIVSPCPIGVQRLYL
jgi:hypothetical protein